MKVDWDQQAAGMTLVEVRDLLKEAANEGSYTVSGIASRLVPSEDRSWFWHRKDDFPAELDRAGEILRMLAASGLVQAPHRPADVHDGKVRHPGYAPTSLGMSLMRATKAPRFSRAKADEAVAALRAGIRQAIADESLMYDVVEVAIYGSYLTDSETLGDVDVAYKLSPRWSGRGRGGFREMRARLEEAHPPSRTQAGAYDHDYTWDVDSVKRMIAPGRRIQLTDIDHVRQLGCPIRVIHPEERDEPAREGWTGSRGEIVLRDDDGSALAAIEADIARLMNGGVEPGTGDALRSVEDYEAAIDRVLRGVPDADIEPYLSKDKDFRKLTDGVADAIAVLVGHGDRRSLRVALRAGVTVLPPDGIPHELGAMLLDRDVPVHDHPLLFSTFPVIAAKHGYVPGMRGYTIPHSHSDIRIDNRRRPVDHAERLAEIMGRAGETVDREVARSIVEAAEWQTIYRGGYVEAVHALDGLLARELGVAARPLADIVLAMRGLKSDNVLSSLMRMRSGGKAVAELPEGIRTLHTAQPLTDAHLSAAGYAPGCHRGWHPLRDGAAVLGFLPWQVEELGFGYAREGGLAHVDVEFRDGRRRRVTMDDLDRASAPAEAPGADATSDELMPLVTANLRVAFVDDGRSRTGHHEPGFTYRVKRGGRRPRDPLSRTRRWAALAGQEVEEPAPPRLVLRPDELPTHEDGFDSVFGSSGSGFGSLSPPPSPDPVERARYGSSSDREPTSML